VALASRAILMPDRRMTLLAKLAIGVVALLHGYFFVLESFLWDTPYGRKTFGLTAERAAATRTLAINQGVYNAFLAAGLAWSLALGPAGRAVSVFFLVCVAVAGVVGGATASPKILVVQAVPAALALLLLTFS
jgi:putative membrane protein